MNGKENKRHYSEKGGHKKRSIEWAAVRKQCPNAVLTRDEMWRMRLGMLRVARDGNEE